MLYNRIKRLYTAEEEDFPVLPYQAISDLKAKYLGKETAVFHKLDYKDNQSIWSENTAKILNNKAKTLLDYFFMCCKVKNVKGTVLCLRNGECSWLDESTKPKKEEEPTYPDITDPKAFTSTRKTLIAIGGNIVYDGNEYKFESDKHRSPAREYIPRLCKTYLMQVVIPNALLSKKFRHGTTFDTVFNAVDHCMTVRKSLRSQEFWREFKESDDIQEIKDAINFYVFDKKRDGSAVDSQHRCYFDKFVNLNCNTQTKFKKGKLDEEVDKLIERMKDEPELGTASYRQLREMGISDRLARLFMKKRGD